MVVRSIKSKKLEFNVQCWFDALVPLVNSNGMGHLVETLVGDEIKMVPKWSILKFMRKLGHALLNPKDRARYTKGLFDIDKMKQHVQSGGLYYTHNPLSKFILLYLDVDDHAEGQVDKKALTKAIVERFGDAVYEQGGRLWIKFHTDGNRERAYTKIKAFCRVLDAWREAKGFACNIDLPKGITTLGRLPGAESTEEDLHRFLETPTNTLDTLCDWIDGLVAELPAGYRQPATVKSARLPKAKNPVAGSRPSFADFTKEQRLEMPMLRMKHLHIGRWVLDTINAIGTMEKYRVPGQRIVMEDVAHELTVDLLTHNENGAKPQAQCEHMWNKLRDEFPQDFPRGWCHKKHAAIRNMLNDLAMVFYTNSRYLFHRVPTDGTPRKPGRAMRWGLAPSYDSVYLSTLTVGTGNHALGCTEEEGAMNKASLGETTPHYLYERTRPVRVWPDEAHKVPDDLPKTLAA